MSIVNEVYLFLGRPDATTVDVNPTVYFKLIRNPYVDDVRHIPLKYFSLFLVKETIITNVTKYVFTVYDKDGKTMHNFTTRENFTPKFYTYKQEKVIIDYGIQKISISLENGMLVIKTPVFEKHLKCGVEILCELDGVLIYKQDIMRNYKIVFQKSNGFDYYRLYYNGEKILLFEHDINTTNVKQIMIGEDLIHLFKNNDTIEESLKKYSKFLNFNYTTDSDKAIEYTKLMTNQEKFAPEKLDIIERSIIDDIKANRSVSKEKLKIYASMLKD